MQQIEKNLDGAGLRIGIVQARFNSEVGEGLRAGCLEELQQLGVGADSITLGTVPGALEVPLLLSRMAKSGRYDGLIALGAVIRGETYHFEVVSNESARGIQAVQLETGVPIANAILTTEDDAQALARMVVKGREAAQVAVEMIHLLRSL